MAFDIPPVPSWLGNPALTRFLNDLRSRVQAIVAGNAFGTIAVPGQSDVVADSPGDTLNLIAGSGVAITTNPVTDEVTIDFTGGGSGTVTSLTATTPIVATPSPITNTGVISHAVSGVAAGTYGDATNVPQIAIDAKGHVTSASSIAIGGGGTVTSITATSPIVVTPSPITGAGDVSHAASGVTPGSYGDGTHVPSFTVEADGHLTAAANQLITFPSGNGWMFGNGADGVVHFDGTNTFSFAAKSGNNYFINRSVYATDCIIDAGVSVNTHDWLGISIGGGMQIFCTGTFTNNGLCGSQGARNTVNLQNGGEGTPPGISGIFLFGSNGGNGGVPAGPITGRPGSAIARAWGGNGGNGGASATPNAGGTGGVATAPSDQETGGVNFLSFPMTMIQGRQPFASSPNWFLLAGGAGGAGGGCITGTVNGGGGGGGGGVFLVAARLIASGSGILSCDGAAGNTGNGGSGIGGGGGGGGGGGLLMIITTTANYAALLTCQALGGAGGAKVGPTGTAGTAGSNGRVVALIVT